MAASGLEDQENVPEAADQREEEEEEEGGGVEEEFRQVDTNSQRQEGFCKRCSVFIKESFERR